MKHGEFSESTKGLIRQRAKSRCEACGLTIMGGAQYHHRKPRRMGGSREVAVSRPSNGVMLHPKCHERIEANRTRAYERGWLVGDNDSPEAVPVKMWMGWVLLIGPDAVPCDPPDLEGQ